MKRVRDRIADLAAWTDEIGVLSLIVGATPERAAERATPWAITIKTGISDARDAVRERFGPTAVGPFDERIDEVQPTIEQRLFAHNAPGRGRALYVGISSGRVEHIATQVPFQDAVKFRSRPYLTPLVTAASVGRPVGLLRVDRGAVMLDELAAGMVEHIWSDQFAPQSSDWRENAGPGMSNPNRAQESSTQTDHFEERVDANRQRFLRSVAQELQTRTSEHGWDTVILAGDARLTKTIEQHCSLNGDVQVHHRDITLEDVNDGQLIDAFQPVLEELHREREQHMLDTLGGAIAEDRAVAGVNDVTHALNEARVEALIVDPQMELSGVASPDGRLFGDREDPRAVGEQLSDVDDLIHRMIHRALDTSADVAVVTSEAERERLDGHGAVAATLRW